MSTSQGHPRLVNAIAKFYSMLIDRNLDANKEVLVTSGAYEALYSSLQGHTNPGDEWIIIEPFFDCYVPMVQSAGGIVRYIALKPVRILSFDTIQTERRRNKNENTKESVRKNV